MNTLEDIFRSFETGIRSSKAIKPKEYLNRLGLDYNKLRIGFNSGQFHHNKKSEFKDKCEALGLLTKSDVGVNKKGLTPYTVFGRYGIIFPLLDKHNQIVNFFAIRFDLASPKEEHLNSEGIYPCYPNKNTRRLYLTANLIDCASLTQSNILENKDAVMALHNGQVLPQHKEAIKSLVELEEIIIFKN